MIPPHKRMADVLESAMNEVSRNCTTPPHTFKVEFDICKLAEPEKTTVPVLMVTTELAIDTTPATAVETAFSCMVDAPVMLSCAVSATCAVCTVIAADEAPESVSLAWSLIVSSVPPSVNDEPPDNTSDDELPKVKALFGSENELVCVSVTALEP